MKGMVLDVVPRVDPSSSRSARAHGAPVHSPALETIVAAAMLEFVISDDGVCSDFSLHGLDRRVAGESAVVVAVERRLAALTKAEGLLITHNGHRDLGALRLAALRHRHFSIDGASSWLRDPQDRHDDVMLLLSAQGVDDLSPLPHLTAALGGCPEVGLTKTGLPPRREMARAEFNVLQTMIVYLHLLSERHRSVQPLARGVPALSDLILEKSATAPHLSAMLETDVFKGFAYLVF